MLILDLTVSVKPKKVFEWKYYILPSIFSLSMSKCPDYVWREIEH